MIEIFLASLLIGVLAGISAGLFGIGGGVLIVPFLTWLFEIHQFNSQQILLMAVASSLATALPTSTASLWTHHKLNNIVWNRAFRLVPSLLLASICGAVLAEFIRPELLRWFFVSYLLYNSLRLAWPQSSIVVNNQPRLYLDYPMGFVIGTISAILGIGGGTITVPYLVGSGLPIKNAVATSSACALPIAISSAISYIFLGWQSDNLPEGSLGYVYLPAFLGISATSVFTAPIGARLAHRLPPKKLKRYFAVLLLLMALKMAY